MAKLQKINKIFFFFFFRFSPLFLFVYDMSSTQLFRLLFSPSSFCLDVIDHR